MSWTISFAVIASTFGLIFIAELPDKTALATLILATRLRARDVILGAWAAFAVQTLVGVAAGSVLILLPVTPIRVASGIGFLVFAFLAFRRNEEEVESEEEAVAKTETGRPAWLISFMVIFAAEWGDLTQLATAAPLARASKASQVATPAFLAPPVRWWTPPRLSIWLPYSAVVTWPICSPPARTAAVSGPRWRSVSIFTFRPQ
jgi:putative Ca2+/H+ antiporter (TMEM165/GDT1 family)